MAKVYHTKKQEAARLNISIRTLDRHCHENGFPYVRIGQFVMFDPDLSDAYMAARTFRGRTAELAKMAA